MNRFTKLFLIAFVTIVTTRGAIAKDVQVKGYTKKDGTVVVGYERKKAKTK